MCEHHTSFNYGNPITNSRNALVLTAVDLGCNNIYSIRDASRDIREYRRANSLETQTASEPHVSPRVAPHVLSGNCSSAAEGMPFIVPFPSLFQRRGNEQCASPYVTASSPAGRSSPPSLSPYISYRSLGSALSSSPDASDSAIVTLLTRCFRRVISAIEMSPC